MSLYSTVSLGALRIQAQQRADLVNSQNITTSEWNQMISQSYKRLYDMLVAAYGNDYYVKAPYQFTINSTSLYDLPGDLYKLLGVDLQYSASSSGWVTLKRFEFIGRNKCSWLNPTPISSALAQLWYIPSPTSLQFLPTCATTASSATITTPDASDLTVGMSVDGAGVVAGTTVLSTNVTVSPNTILLSAPVTATAPYVTLLFWRDDTTIVGISGWEEFIIVDAAIKAGVKEEMDVSDLRIQKAEMVDDIKGMAEGRDAGQAHHVSDVLSINSPVLQIGATPLQYRLLGSQIQFVPVTGDGASDSMFGDGYGY